MLCHINCRIVLHRISIFDVYDLGAIISHEIVGRVFFSHIFDGILIILPDVEGVFIGMTSDFIEHDPLNGIWEGADNTIINYKINSAFLPDIMLPVGSNIRIGTLFGQSTVQVVENALEWPLEFDTLLY